MISQGLPNDSMIYQVLSDEVSETLLVLFFAAYMCKRDFYGFFFGGRYFFSTEVTTT